MLDAEAAPRGVPPLAKVIERGGRPPRRAAPGGRRPGPEDRAGRRRGAGADRPCRSLRSRGRPGAAAGVRPRTAGGAGSRARPVGDHGRGREEGRRPVPRAREGELLLALDGKLAGKTHRLYRHRPLRRAPGGGGVGRRRPGALPGAPPHQAVHARHGRRLPQARDRLTGSADPAQGERRTRARGGSFRGIAESTLPATAPACFTGLPPPCRETVMTDPAPRYLDTSQAARYLGISPKTLMRIRVTGDGPRYAKAGRRVIYDRIDLGRLGRGTQAPLHGRVGGRMRRRRAGILLRAKKFPCAWR